LIKLFFLKEKFGYDETVISEKHAVVVYKEIGDDGFVITAFMTSRPDKIA
jgi:hypothetical protein